MAKSNAIEDALAALKALRGKPVTDETRRQLAKGLESRANIIAARAAELVQELRVIDLEPDLQRSFERFHSGAAQDKAYIAQVAIAKAAVELGLRAEGIFLAGVQSVPAGLGFGDSSDAAAELCGLCITGLCQMGHREACNEAIDLLMHRKPHLRVAAARALGVSRRDEAALVLRLKLLSGDRDGDVLAECLHSLARIWPQKSVRYIAAFLNSSDRVVRENAALALAATRQREAFERLNEHWRLGGVRAESRPAVLLAIAMTRFPEALELLLSVVSSGKPDAAADALEAVAMYRHDESARAKIEAAVKQRDDPALHRAFINAFRTA